MTDLQQLIFIVKGINTAVEESTRGISNVFKDEDPEDVRIFIREWMSASAAVECEIANYLDHHILASTKQEAVKQ